MSPIIIGREENIKKKLKPEIVKESIEGALKREFVKYSHVPWMIDNVYLRSETLRKKFEDVKKFIPNAPNYPIEVIFAVGGMSSTSLTENLEYYKEISEKPIISEEEITEAYQKTARNNDFDLYIITKSSKNIDRYAHEFKKGLPLPDKVKEIGFEGYEIHGDCRKSVEEATIVIEHFKGNNGKSLMIGEHDKEVWERTTEKKNKPYIIWKNPKIDKKLKEELDEYLENKWLRTKEEFLDITFREYVKTFKKLFPEEYEKGIEELRKTWPRFKEYERFYKPKPI